MIEITVVIPSYNRKKLLARALDALKKQDLPQDRFEVIIVDDGSTDGTEKIVDNYRDKVKNLKYLRQEHKGPASARNLGIRQAKGETIAFTDSDCEVMPDWLKKILETFSNNRIIGIAGRVITERAHITPFTHQVVASGDDFASCNMAFKRSVLRELGGFDENFIFPCCEDTDLSLRVQRCGNIIYNKDVVVCHPPLKQTLIQFIRRIGVICEGQFLLCRKHPSLFLYRRSLLGVIRVVGLRMFWNDLVKNRYFIRRTPFQYLLYLFALFCQRVYLIYFLIGNYNRLKNIGG